MLSTVSSYQRWLSQMRSTPASPFLDCFVATLVKAGYRPRTIRRFVRGAAHFSLWLKRREQFLTEASASEIQRFKRHCASCTCPGFMRSSRRHSSWRHGRGAGLFLRHLQDIGVVARSAPASPQPPPLLSDFCRWMQQHRGVKDQTLKIYGRVILDALGSLGDDPSRYDARHLRAFEAAHGKRNEFA